ncbi:MAG TPA: hypothetical protein PLY26_06455, partial [Ferruginibacter sp.]|nr:hypothetical protein [Ferruginibacter sp.]
LKICRSQDRAGSIPVLGTNDSTSALGLFLLATKQRLIMKFVILSVAKDLPNRIIIYLGLEPAAPVDNCL